MLDAADTDQFFVFAEFFGAGFVEVFEAENDSFKGGGVVWEFPFLAVGFEGFNGGVRKTEIAPFFRHSGKPPRVLFRLQV